MEKIKEIAFEENIKLANINALGVVNVFNVGVFKIGEKNIIQILLQVIMRLYLLLEVLVH